MEEYGQNLVILNKFQPVKLFLIIKKNQIRFFFVANSLRDMWNRKQQEKRAPEFDGRNEYPPPRIIPLYVNLNTKTVGNPPNVLEKI